jgi:hypothetical protein
MEGKRLASGVIRWLFASILVFSLAGLGALLYVYSTMAGLWPASMRHGPDTEEARSVYSRYFPGIPLDRVDSLYAWDSWSGPGETILYMKFVLIGHADLLPFLDRMRVTPADTLQGETRRHIPYFSGPRWWPDIHDLEQYPQVFQRNQHALWYDPRRRTVCYQWADVF